MDRKEVVNRIAPMAREVFEKPDLELCDTLDATQVDTWTSFAFMQLLGKIEEEFKILVSPEKISEIQTIADIVKIVEESKKS